MKRLLRINAVVEVDEEDNDSCIFALAEEIDKQITLKDQNDKVKSMIVVDVKTYDTVYEKRIGKNNK